MKRIVALTMCAASLGAAAQLPDYVPTDGLVGWWPFEGSLENFGSNGDEGLAYDGGEGIAFGTTYNLDRFSNPGSALQIEYGSYAYLGLDFALELTPTDTMTIAFWSKPDTNEVVVLTKYQNGNLNSSWFVANYWSEGVRAIGNGTSETPNEDQWYSMCPNPTNGWAHAVVVFRGGTTSLWVNGTSICEVTNPVSAGEQTQPVLVGRSNCPGLNGHTECNNSSGCFDDLGFWNRALSSEEILGLYLAAPPVLGCMDPEACNFDDEAVLDDGSCISCDFIATFCGVGTIWDSATQTCIGDGSGDINLDGCVQLNDLLDLLSAYGDCGAEESPWQCGDLLEYQGYDYVTVQIGEQCWFAENLRTENYSNGDPVQSDLSSSDWVASTEGASAVYGESGSCEDSAPDFDACDSSIALAIYGRLYNWYAVDDERSLCPNDWHVPTDNEWMDLEIEIGMAEGEAMQTNCRGDVQGNVLKTTTGWNGGGNGTDVWGFSANPVGYRAQNGQFQDGGDEGHWWTADSHNQSNAWYRGIASWDGRVCRNPNPKNLGFAVRCLKDIE